jgi:surface antigen Omp85-like protein
MRGSLALLVLLSFSVSALAQRPTSTADTLTPPATKDIIPYNIKLPKLPLPHKISSHAAANRNVLAFPFAVRSLETSWGLGGVVARFFNPGKRDTTIRTSDANVLLLYTLRSQLIIVLNSTIYFPHEDHIVRFQASYSYYPDDFWGLGNQTDYKAKTPFAQKQFFFNPQFLKRVYHNIYLGVTYQFQHTTPLEHTPGDVFDREDITGRFGGITSGIGPILSWDTRNNAFSPDKGGFAEIQFAYFPTFLGSAFKFRVLSVDLRRFFRLSARSVLALQGLGGLTFGNTPFRYLEELGGADMMRGYYGGRYSGKCLMAYQAEYRHSLFWRFGMVLFSAIGEVAPKPANFELAGLHYCGGGGIRFALSKEEKLNLRVDCGIAKHSHAFTVQLREAF